MRPRTYDHRLPIETFAVCATTLTSLVIPMGTPTTSVGEYITECQRVLESMKSEGIRYEVRMFLPLT